MPLHSILVEYGVFGSYFWTTALVLRSSNAPNYLRRPVSELIGNGYIPITLLG